MERLWSKVTVSMQTVTLLSETQTFSSRAKDVLRTTCRVLVRFPKELRIREYIQPYGRRNHTPLIKMLAGSVSELMEVLQWIKMNAVGFIEVFERAEKDFFTRLLAAYCKNQKWEPCVSYCLHFTHYNATDIMHILPIHYMFEPWVPINTPTFLRCTILREIINRKMVNIELINML